MKIAVSTEGPELKSKVARRLGLAPYLLLVDLDLDDFEVVPSPDDSRGGGGMQVVAAVMANKCDVLLTGYCSPMAERYLSNDSVTVITGLSGTAGEILEQYKKGNALAERETSGRAEPIAGKIDRIAVANAVQKAFHQIQILLPLGLVFQLMTGLNLFLRAPGLTDYLGRGTGIKQTLVAVLSGIISTGPIYAWYPLLRELRDKGVPPSLLAVFLVNRAVKPLLIPVMVSFFGWVYVGLLLVLIISGSLGVGFIMGIVLDFPEDVERNKF